ncbi:hypothetical protein CCR94_22155 [Rhodoblastus sphagnicola]|uniref:Tryptophan synthase beta chain-like PALP domain-containing protein n=1 Tax=Rhodoblastus sphagnicola TaxID=333368 RepID=A0A2S6MVG2_9HYPH|nr:pyridoxal-phosphate dependent enzyme [Rhodoblastus sphagnicola]MBB4197562.1 cysteine synthase [Rhodoblastus sphagnicola]PPQ26351.1 hypothetical protein CCR94_22155 [Rhodoblastus sphagnicola]
MAATLHRYDEIVAVDDVDAYRLARELASTEGSSVGPSSGAALWSAMKVLSRPENLGATAVVILPDSGERYLSAGIFARGADGSKEAASA